MKATPILIGPINLDAKCAGKRSAGKPHAAFDEAGVGNGVTQTTAPTLDPTCVQRRLVCSVGVSPTGVRVRSPVAWIVLVEETKLIKPIDKAIIGMVSESSGRNASEPIGGLVRK